MVKNREMLEGKDEIIAQLERQLLELKEAQQQSAATIALDYNSRSLPAPKGLPKSFLKVFRLKMILPMLLVIILGATGIWLFAGSTFKQKSVIFVEHVQELSTLATAEAHLKEVIRETDNKIFGKDISKDLPGTKRELLLIVPGTVIAGVDLKGITSEDMVINEKTKEIDITLPHAKILQEPSVQTKNIVTYENGELFRADTKMDEALEKVAEAQEKMRKAAKDIGLLDTAEKNAEKALKEFFKNIGYKVNITFK